MMKTGVPPYKREGRISGSCEKPVKRKLTAGLLSGSSVLIIPLSFLLGRGQLAGGLMPFGMAFYAAAYRFETNRILAAVFIMLGMLLGRAGEQIYITAAGMLLFSAFNLLLKQSGKPKQNFRDAVAAFASILLPGLLIVYLQGFLLYDLLKLLFSGLVVFLLLFIFREVLHVIFNSQKRQVLTNEEIISIAIMSALALTGLGEIKLIGFSVKNIISILAVLVFSYKSGPGVGAAIGVVMGLTASMSASSTPLLIGSYAFCGLLSGVFRSLGKIGSGFGFAMGNAVLTLYLNGSTEVLIYLKEIILAIGIFIVLPRKLVDKVGTSLGMGLEPGADKRSYSMRVKEITVKKLNKFSNAFRELAKTFNEISQTKVVANKQDISSMFDRVADKVCKDCSLCLHCWDRNFYSTYQVMFRIVERLDAKGRVEASDIPAYFLDRCERINDFIKAVNGIYEVFKVDMVWKNKIGESRELVSQQLEGLSKVISNLASEIDVDLHFKSDIEDSILLELNRAGIKATEAIVYENKWGKHEINIFHKACGGKRSCLSAVEKIVSEVVGRRMTKESSDCCRMASKGMCSLILAEEEAYRVTTGVAKAVKHDGTVSGDHYTFLNSGEGKFIIALSDGMGSGQKAATQSKATISLLEQFMESGFDKDTTVRLINSILVLKSSDDTFSTMDITVIDLYNGETEFVKIGAVPTFIKRSGRTETVKSVSLPAGILSNIELELVHKNVESGDFIIMMTDGIIDSFAKEGEDSIASIVRLLEETTSTNPQHIADMLLDEAIRNCGGKPADDMLVLAAKVWKRVG